jgi:hypothetical protein
MSHYLFVEAASGRIVYLTDRESDPGPSDTFLVTSKGKRVIWRAQLERKAFPGTLPADIHPQNCSRFVLRNDRILEAVK